MFSRELADRRIKKPTISDRDTAFILLWEYKFISQPLNGAFTRLIIFFPPKSQCAFFVQACFETEKQQKPVTINAVKGDLRKEIFGNKKRNAIPCLSRNTFLSVAERKAKQ